jgi:hypothetical protein
MAYSDSILTSSADFTAVSTLTNALHDENDTGWSVFSTTCTYASASTFTITGDYTTTFVKGTKLKFTNSTLKYFIVISSTYGAPSTTVTVMVNTDYVIASAAITGVYIGRGDPVSFPSMFSYSPTVGGFSANPTSAAYTITVSGGLATVSSHPGAAGTSNATSYTLTTPIAAKTLTNGVWTTATTYAEDNGAALTTPGYASIGTAASTINIYKSINSPNWTNANSKRAYFTLTYPI